MRYAAVVLAGGRGRRLGGASKPLTVVGGQPMLHRVLAAVADARPRIVVGPAGLPVPEGVRLVEESGGGPVAGLAAGLSTVDDDGTVALLAADLPLLTNEAVRRLDEALSTVDGAVYVDGQGRRQILCGLWHTGALRRRLSAIEPANARLRDLLDGLSVAEVRSADTPWYDCDSPADLAYVEGKLTVSQLDDWLTRVRAELALDDGTDPGLVLDLARDVAHGVARPAAPLTAYLLGLAVGRGADPRATAATVTALAREWPPDGH